MIGLPYIEALFRTVLEASNKIQGRLVYCARMGAELNFDQLNQVLQEEFGTTTPGDKYPLVLMMPPLSFAGDDWERYNFTLFFLDTSFYNSDGSTKDPNLDTGTSKHEILHDQADMGRCARNFLTTLDEVARTRGLVKDKFRLSARGATDTATLTPVSYIGNDRASGMRLDFVGSVFSGCLMEDYNPEEVAAIKLPTDDPHPAH